MKQSTQDRATERARFEAAIAKARANGETFVLPRGEATMYRWDLGRWFKLTPNGPVPA